MDLVTFQPWVREWVKEPYESQKVAKTRVCVCVKGGRVMKDIVNQASNQLAVVRVIRDPHVVLSGVNPKLEVGLTETPTWTPVVLLDKE